MQILELRVAGPAFPLDVWFDLNFISDELERREDGVSAWCVEFIYFLSWLPSFRIK